MGLMKQSGNALLDLVKKNPWTAAGAAGLGGLGVASGSEDPQQTTVTQQPVEEPPQQQSPLPTASNPSYGMDNAQQPAQNSTVFADAENQRLAENFGVFIANPDRKDGETPIYRNYAPNKNLLTSPEAYDEATALLKQKAESASGDAFHKRAAATADLHKYEATVASYKTSLVNERIANDEMMVNLQAQQEAMQAALAQGEQVDQRLYANINSALQQKKNAIAQEVDNTVGRDANIQLRLTTAQERVKQSNLDVATYQNRAAHAIASDKAAENPVVRLIADFTQQDPVNALALVKSPGFNKSPLYATTLAIASSPTGMPDAFATVSDIGVDAIPVLSANVVRQLKASGVAKEELNKIGTGYTVALNSAHTNASQVALDRENKFRSEFTAKYEGRSVPQATLQKLAANAYKQAYDKALMVETVVALRRSGLDAITNLATGGKVIGADTTPAELISITKRIPELYSQHPELRNAFNLTANRAQNAIKSLWVNSIANKHKGAI